MCVIIYTRHPDAISDKVLLNMAENNPHGAGAMWWNRDGIVQLRKHLGTIQDSVELFREVSAEAAVANSPLAFHFRKRTTGEVSEDMCHPFQAGVWSLMHNGTIDGLRPTDAEAESDTQKFARMVKSLTRDFGEDAILKPSMRKLLGMGLSGNRALLMKNGMGNRGAVLLNPGLWTFIDVHAVSNLYAWDSYTLTKGRFGTKEMEKRRKEQKGQISLFQSKPAVSGVLF